MRGITKFSIAAAIIGIGSLLISYIGGPSQAAIDNTPDCDTVAIMYCGAFSEGQFHSKWNNDKKYKDHGTIFSAFGINKADVTGMVDGIVWRDGRVTLGSSANGKVVATNAITAGRWNNPASDMTKIAGTSRAYKMPTRHFVTEGQTAMIKMVNGQFKFAIIKSCGNPVTATPTAKPVYSCDALKATVDTQSIYKYNFAMNVTAKNGATVHDYVVNFGDGSETKIFGTNNFSHTYAKPGTYRIKSSVRVKVGGSVRVVTSSACETTVTIKEPVKTQPVAKCELLDQPIITNRTNVALKATASAKDGAKISGYVFTINDANGKQVASQTVNTTSTSASTHFNISQAGSYKAKVTVKTSLGNKTAAACEKNFTIKEADKPGVSIEKTVNGVKEDVVQVDQPFTYEIVVKNTGNVDLKDVKVEDKAPEGVTFKSADKGKIENNVWTHTIPEIRVGSQAKFTITAVVSKYFEDNRINTACVDTPTVPGKPDDCDDATITTPKPDEETVCLLEGKVYPHTIKKGDFDPSIHSRNVEDCREVPPVTPPELPQTGGTDGILNALGLGALVTTTLAYVASRRNSLIG